MKGFLLYAGLIIFIGLYFEIVPNFILEHIGPYFDDADVRSGGNLGIAAENNLLKAVTYTVAFVFLLWLVCLGWLTKMFYLREEEPEFMYLMLFFGFVVVPLTVLLGPVLKYLPVLQSIL